HPRHESLAGMAAHAGGVSGGNAGRYRVPGGIPLGPLDVMRRGVVALIAGARAEGHGNQVRVAKRVSVLAAWAVAILALDVAAILQVGRHGVEIAVGQHRREGPVILRSDVIKPAV